MSRKRAAETDPDDEEHPHAALGGRTRPPPMMHQRDLPAAVSLESSQLPSDSTPLLLVPLLPSAATRPLPIMQPPSLLGVRPARRPQVTQQVPTSVRPPPVMQPSTASHVPVLPPRPPPLTSTLPASSYTPVEQLVMPDISLMRSARRAPASGSSAEPQRRGGIQNNSDLDMDQVEMSQEARDEEELQRKVRTSQVCYLYGHSRYNQMLNCALETVSHYT